LKPSFSIFQRVLPQATISATFCFVTGRLLYGQKIETGGKAGIYPMPA
jgi:hypothetical protein